MGKGLFIGGFGLGWEGYYEGYLEENSREHSSGFCRDQKGAAAKGHVVMPLSVEFSSE
jgi:hypothetical protein